MTGVHFAMNAEEIMTLKHKIPLKVVIAILVITLMLSFIFSKLEDSIGILVSLGTSLAAALLYNRMLEDYEDKKLRELRNITNYDFLTKLLNDLKKFNHTYAEDWHVNIKLTTMDSDINDAIRDNFYKCTISYSYKKNIKTNKIKMIFYRIFNENDIDDIPKHIDLANEYEFYWIMDERKWPRVVDNSSYSISNLIVNTNSATLNRKIDSNEIIYNANIKDIKPIANGSEYFDISFDAKFLVEKADTIKISLDVPTKNARIVFDYSNIKEEIVTYGMESISFTDNPIMKEEDDAWKFVYNDWLMPKNSFVFCWWKKND